MPKVAEGYLEARRQSIIAAASRVFSQKGVQAATMAEVAREAGISPGAIYRYFESKEALAAGCFDERAQPVLSQWTLEPDPNAEPLGFRDLCFATIALLDDPGEEPHTILDIEHTLRTVRDGDPQQVADLREQCGAMATGIRSRVEMAQAAGDLPRTVDPQVLADLLLTIWWGFRLQKLQIANLDAAAQLDLLLRLIGTPGSAAK